MKNIERRLKNLEEKLKVNQKNVISVIEVVYVKPDGKGGRIERYPTRPIEQLKKYKEQMKQPPIGGERTIFIYPDDE